MDVIDYCEKLWENPTAEIPGPDIYYSVVLEIS
jgi:hypothetical protein